MICSWREGNKDMDNKSILIIGGPNSGKTHFGGQLYLRFRCDEYNYKILTPPEDLTIFEEVVNCLYDGRSAKHTNSESHKNLSLEIIDHKENTISISFPDYGGEQIRQVVNNRQINDLWQNQIENSNNWMLFIRLDEIPEIEDIVNRPLPEKVETKNNANSTFKISDNAFYVELLQMFLFTKNVSTKQDIELPKLMIILSCWDLLKTKETPSEVLKKRLPLFYEYVVNLWDENCLQIMGLSSTEKTLSNKKSDDAYLNSSPEKFGYIVLPDGKKEKDLTLLINKLVE